MKTDYCTQPSPVQQQQPSQAQQPQLPPVGSKLTQPSKSLELVVPHKFTYEFFESNRYTISENENYEALCNNGFIKLYTLKCRVYWLAQNTFAHEVPDWKFHVSVAHKDLKKAWNLLVGLFIKMECRAGMKVIYLKQARNPQRGREITIYIIKYSQQFDNSYFAKDFGLHISIEHSSQYWTKFFRQIENLLISYEIESNGLADGDLQLGRYVSLRNEAFIKNEIGEGIYPPNSAGWNPLKQELPFTMSELACMAQKEQAPTFATKYRSKIISLAVGISLLSLGVILKLHSIFPKQQ